MDHLVPAGRAVIGGCGNVRKSGPAGGSEERQRGLDV